MLLLGARCLRSRQQRPQGPARDPAPTRPSGSACLSFGSFPFPGREQSAWGGRGFRTRSRSRPGAEPELGPDVRMSGFLLPIHASSHSRPPPPLLEGDLSWLPSPRPPRPPADEHCSGCRSSGAVWVELRALWPPARLRHSPGWRRPTGRVVTRSRTSTQHRVWVEEQVWALWPLVPLHAGGPGGHLPLDKA